MRHKLKLVIQPQNIDIAIGMLQAAGFKERWRTHEHGLAFFYIYSNKEYTVEHANKSKRSFRISDDDIMWQTHLAAELLELDGSKREVQLRYKEYLGKELDEIRDALCMDGSSDNDFHVTCLKMFVRLFNQNPAAAILLKT